MLLDQRLFSVFPMDMGVIPKGKRDFLKIQSIPHGCGGDPNWSRI